MNRKSEKMGWTLGWLGGFLWVAILSVVFLFQGNHLPGLTGLSLFCLSVVAVLTVTPWRYPTTPYGKLMLAPYGMFALSIIWVVWAYGGIQKTGLTWWNLLWLLPMLIPFGTISRKKWMD
jgi:hypothetical protein